MDSQVLAIKQKNVNKEETVMPMSPGATRSGGGGTKGTTKKASAKTGGAKATAKK